MSIEAKLIELKNRFLWQVAGTVLSASVALAAFGKAAQDAMESFQLYPTISTEKQFRMVGNNVVEYDVPLKSLNPDIDDKKKHDSLMLAFAAAGWAALGLAGTCAGVGFGMAASGTAEKRHYLQSLERR